MCPVNSIRAFTFYITFTHRNCEDTYGIYWEYMFGFQWLLDQSLDGLEVTLLFIMKSSLIRAENIIENS